MAGTTRGFLYVYDCESRKQMRHLCKHSKFITSLAIDDTFHVVLSASIDGKISVWDYERNWHLDGTFDVESQCLKQVAFDPTDVKVKQ